MCFFFSFMSFTFFLDLEQTFFFFFFRNWPYMKGEIQMLKARKQSGKNKLCIILRWVSSSHPFPLYPSLVPPSFLPLFFSFSSLLLLLPILFFFFFLLVWLSTSRRYLIMLATYWYLKVSVISQTYFHSHSLLVWIRVIGE